jgi:hypothetical protein
MGAKLVSYYALAKARGGLALQLKLAMRTTMSQPNAEAAPDSPENLAMFYTALRELLPEETLIPIP